MCFRLRLFAFVSCLICCAKSTTWLYAPNATVNGSVLQNATISSVALQNSMINESGLQNATSGQAVQHVTSSGEDPLAVISSDAMLVQKHFDFAASCKPYPGKRVVMVSISEEYLDMFRNWLHFAGRYLNDTEQLVAVAEDLSVEVLLRQLANTTEDGQPAPLPRFDVVRSSGATSVGEDPNRTALRGSSVERNVSEDPDAPHFDSQPFGDLVTQRSTHMLAFLHQGCTVLYSDIDNVWVKDPFHELARLPGKDLLATDDEAPNVTSHSYLCTCFLYVQPSRATEDLMTAWGQASAGQRTNQRPFNAVLQEAQEAGRLTSGVLPASEFPPGKVASDYPNATIFHANWVSGLPKKIEFFEDRGLWSLPKDEGARPFPQKVFTWAGSLAKNVTAWAHRF